MGGECIDAGSRRARPRSRSARAVATTLGRLEVTRRLVRGPVVLGPVDDPGLQAGVDLAVGHRRRVGAERFHHRDEQVRLLHADLHALEVGQPLDRLLRGVDGARATVVEGQPDHALAGHGGQDLVADRAVEHVVHVLDRAEHEGQRDRDGLGHHVVERPGTDAHHVEPADLELLDRVALGAQRARGIDLHAELAARLVLQRMYAYMTDMELPSCWKAPLPGLGVLPAA